MKRVDGRENTEMRPVKITRGINKHAEGSVLIEVGDTKVICTATVEDRLPNWRKLEGKGWVTAEYSMLPRSTGQRSPRDSVRGRPNGRTLEIQRLIGRALRSVTDMEALGEYNITLDCDVIQADGGTRTASITGAFVALADAMQWMIDNGLIPQMPLRDFVAATSVGILQGEIIMDLCYTEDSAAEVDMNIVMTGSDRFVEIQGTGEEASFSREETDQLLNLARDGIKQLINYQKQVLGPVADSIGK
ncbi:ribonuclease PH [Desulfoscipio geothermicus]|jgi:ribonuclease PH|uniref:Ribonuclease PH n=1 Tax=Desulfoscipio geothermicus DSM 3669 TaxID=1121426 RepID=A0A1I6E550_9FIRM|nr:ribonuclease PH [Desulfoscipio geothermicus]SFR12836.1 RNAse PH [Desulfoscipio geothermicus DSM 3669]